MTVKLLENPRVQTDRGSTLESRVSALENYVTLLLGSIDIANGAITEEKIDNNAVTELKIASQAVSNAKIAINAIQGAVIASGAITENKLYTGAVTADKIAANTITAAKIAVNTITASEIASNAITANEINAGAVTSIKIFAGAVTSDKITVTNLSAINANMGTLTAGKISAVTSLRKIELDSTVPHMKVAYNNTDVIQMAVVGSAPVLEVYYGGYIRTRLNKNSLNFFGTTGASICTFYAQSSGGPGMYIDTPSNPLYVVAPQLVVDGSTFYLNFGTAQNSLVANGTNLTFGGDTACNLIPNSSGSYNIGSSGGYWNDIYLKRIRTLSFSTDPSSRDFGDMWHHYEGAGAKQFRGCPASTTIYSFDMTVV